MTFSDEALPVGGQEISRLKRNRSLLVSVLETLGRPIYGAQKARVDGNSVRCPFHHDGNPSGSIHSPDSGASVWLFTCHSCAWNQCARHGPSGTGDVIHIARNALAKHGEPFGFGEAVRHLRRFREGTADLSASVCKPLSPIAMEVSPDPAKLAKARGDMPIAQQTLRSDPVLLESLFKTRAVDHLTAERFGVGYSDEESKGAYWAFPIQQRDGVLMVVKLHAVDTAFPKSFWYPPDSKKGHPLYPVGLQSPGPIWLCSGEFKALAVISAGLPAIGVTSGESVIHVTDELVRLIGDRIVVIVPDNDAVGIAWANGMASLLKAKGIRSRIVDLDLQESRGDIADWMVQRRVTEGVSAEDIRAELLKRFAEASG